MFSIYQGTSGLLYQQLGVTTEKCLAKGLCACNRWCDTFECVWVCRWRATGASFAWTLKMVNQVQLMSMCSQGHDVSRLPYTKCSQTLSCNQPKPAPCY